MFNTLFIFIPFVVEGTLMNLQCRWVGLTYGDHDTA